VTASNIAGTGPASAPLTFVTPGLPGAPTLFNATPGSGSIALTWGAPATDGGSAVSSYTMSCMGGGGGSSAWPGNVIYNFSFGGLTNGTAYTCNVAANNTMGRGPASTLIATPIGATPVPTAPPPTPTPAPVSGFTQLAVGTAFTSASIGSANNYGGIVSGQLNAWNGTSWGPGGVTLTQVAYGNDGTRWGVASNGVIYYRNATSWTTIAGALKQISVGNASWVWGVNSAGSIFKWNGAGWSQGPGIFASISVGADGTLWALQANDSIWRFNGSTWVQIGGALRWISVGSASNVWGVNAGGQVYKLNAAGTGWDTPIVPSGPFVGVSTASDGSTLLLRSDGSLWKR
jgi:hypothetical protein